MKDKHFESLKKNRAKGMYYHAFFYGMLAWGVPMTLMTVFITPILSDREFSFGYLAMILLMCFGCVHLIVHCITLILGEQYRKALLWVLLLFLGLYFLAYELQIVMVSRGEMISAFIIWGVGGYLFGMFSWYSSENSYREELRRRNLSS